MKKRNINFPGIGEIFTLNLYLCSVKLAKVVKAAIAPIQLLYASLTPQRLNSTAQFQYSLQINISFFLSIVSAYKSFRKVNVPATNKQQEVVN